MSDKKTPFEHEIWLSSVSDETLAKYDKHAAFAAFKKRVRSQESKETKRFGWLKYAAAVAAVKKLGEDVGIVMSLKGVVPAEDIDALSADAFKDACTPGNPRPVTVADIKEMFLSLI